jgi:tetratricopeptide (TPR) repeat protein
MTSTKKFFSFLSRIILPMGGSCSKCCVSVVVPTNIAFNQIPFSTDVSIASHSTRILENCIIIWLLDDPSKKFENEKEQLRHLVSELKVFTNPDICIDYIRHIQDEKIFLITSVTYQSIDYFSHLSQIEKIYIFDASSNQNPNASFFSDINILYKQLQQDIELCELDLINFSTISNSLSINLTKDEIAFIFTQIILEIMVRLKFESGAKEVWIDFCRIHYANNIEQLRIIDEFAKSYRPNVALDWLKRTCFITKILNRVERTREIDVLYKLGFFIKHVNMQLMRLHEENKLLMENISVVYRGKTMMKNEFDLLVTNNSNGLLSFSNFLIATIHKDNVIDFIRHRLAIHSNMIAIMFEINIDHTIFNEDTPFALLKDYDEICFSVSTVFRIESIEQTIHNSLIIWLVKLKLIRTNDPQLERLLIPFRTNDLHESPLSCLGKLLMDMGEYRRVEQFFLEMLNDSSVANQPRRLVRVQIGLGTNYIRQGDCNLALEYYQQALRVSLTYLPSDHPDLAVMYKYIADCYLKQNNYNDALENYERAIDLLENNTQSAKTQFIMELQNLVNKTKQLIENNH